MDVALPRTHRWKRRALAIGAAVAATAAVAVAASRLRPAPPSVERASVWADTVRRGAMVRDVRGPGTLVPEDVRWVTAASPGRIERIALLPGVAVEPETVLVELSNPELEQAVLALASQLRAAEARRTRLRLQLEGERVAQESLLMALQSELEMAQVEAEADEELRASGNGSPLEARRSRAKATQLAARITGETKRLGTLQRSAPAQLLVEDADLANVRAQLGLRRAQADALTVRAGVAGMLQRLGDEGALRVGQHVTPGAPLARIADQTRLKAEIKIPETQAKDVQLGQRAAIDTRNGVVPGRVVRIDPAVQNGTVTVDVALDAPAPPGARPDLTVEGTITLERLADVVFVGRPVSAQPGSVTGLFKIVDGGRAAVRIAVRVGRSSADAIELLGGAEPGDQLILSDMSHWDAHDRIRLQ